MPMYILIKAFLDSVKNLHLRMLSIQWTMVNGQKRNELG